MGRKKIKRIIAREGMILLGIVILGLVLYFINKHLNNIYLVEHQQVKFKVMQNMKYGLIGYTPYLRMMSFGFNSCVCIRISSQYPRLVTPIRLMETGCPAKKNRRCCRKTRQSGSNVAGRTALTGVANHPALSRSINANTVRRPSIR